MPKSEDDAITGGGSVGDFGGGGLGGGGRGEGGGGLGLGGGGDGLYEKAKELVIVEPPRMYILVFLERISTSGVYWLGVTCNYRHQQYCNPSLGSYMHTKEGAIHT